MSETENKRRYGFFFKEKAMLQAKNYPDLPFYKKSKNILVIFFIVISILGFFLALYGLLPGFDMVMAISGISINMLLAIFVFFNHRWAIVLIGVIYSIDKVIFIIDGVGNPLSHIVFFLIVSRMCYISFLVASELKRLKKEENVADTFS